MSPEVLESAAIAALQTSYAAYRRVWPDGDKESFLVWAFDELRGVCDARIKMDVPVSPQLSGLRGVMHGEVAYSPKERRY